MSGSKKKKSAKSAKNGAARAQSRPTDRKNIKTGGAAEKNTGAASAKSAENSRRQSPTRPAPRRKARQRRKTPRRSAKMPQNAQRRGARLRRKTPRTQRNVPTAAAGMPSAQAPIKRGTKVTILTNTTVSPVFPRRMFLFRRIPILPKMILYFLQKS